MSIDEIKIFIALKLDPATSLKVSYVNYASFGRSYQIYTFSKTTNSIIPINLIASGSTEKYAWQLAYKYYYDELPWN